MSDFHGIILHSSGVNFGKLFIYSLNFGKEIERLINFSMKMFFDSCLSFMQRKGGFIIRSLQGTEKYRQIIRKIRLDFKICEVSEQDLVGYPGFWMKNDMPGNPDVINYGACKGRFILGFVQLVRWPQKESPFAGHWFFGLWVQPILRRLGIGESLMLKVIEKARDDGAKELLCLVRENNQNALNLYSKLGFEKTKITQGYSYVLRLRLNGSQWKATDSNCSLARFL